MKQLAKFALQDGSTVLVEVEEPEPLGGIEPTARSGNIVEITQTTLEAALENIEPLARAIMARLRELNQPDAIELEFGIKLSAEFGVFFAAAANEANFGIKLTWQNKPQALEETARAQASPSVVKE